VLSAINLQVYPRIIQVGRQATNAGAADTTIGLAGYSGAEAAPAPADPQGILWLFTGIAASIQAGPTGRKKDSALPQDVVFMPTWNIYVPLSALAKGTVRDRDIIVDDEGYRYEVGQAYWNILGWKIICIRLEA
jgi:hypothetical protein